MYPNLEGVAFDDMLRMEIGEKRRSRELEAGLCWKLITYMYLSVQTEFYRIKWCCDKEHFDFWDEIQKSHNSRAKAAKPSRRQDRRRVFRPYGWADRTMPRRQTDTDKSSKDADAETEEDASQQPTLPTTDFKIRLVPPSSRVANFSVTRSLWGFDGGDISNSRWRPYTWKFITIHYHEEVCYSLLVGVNGSPDVEFCGYSIPHPSEPKLNLRIQTYGMRFRIYKELTSRWRWEDGCGCVGEGVGWSYGALRSCWG